MAFRFPDFRLARLTVWAQEGAALWFPHAHASTSAKILAWHRAKLALSVYLPQSHDVSYPRVSHGFLSIMIPFLRRAQ